jgi:hypothetical protein
VTVTDTKFSKEIRVEFVLVMLQSHMELDQRQQLPVINAPTGYHQSYLFVILCANLMLSPFHGKAMNQNMQLGCYLQTRMQTEFCLTALVTLLVAIHRLTLGSLVLVVHYATRVLFYSSANNIIL